MRGAFKLHRYLCVASSLAGAAARHRHRVVSGEVGGSTKATAPPPRGNRWGVSAGACRPPVLWKVSLSLGVPFSGSYVSPPNLLRLPCPRPRLKVAVRACAGGRAVGELDRSSRHHRVGHDGQTRARLVDRWKSACKRSIPISPATHQTRATWVTVKLFNPPLGRPEWSSLTGGGVLAAKRLVESGRRVWAPCATSADEISEAVSPTVAPALTAAQCRGTRSRCSTRGVETPPPPRLGSVQTCVWIHWERTWQTPPTVVRPAFVGRGVAHVGVRARSPSCVGVEKGVCCRSPWPFVHGCCWRCQDVGVGPGGWPSHRSGGGEGLVPRSLDTSTGRARWTPLRWRALGTPPPPPLVGVRVRRAVCWQVPPSQPLHKRSPLPVASTAGQLGAGTLSGAPDAGPGGGRKGPGGHGRVAAQTATLWLCAQACVHAPALCTDCRPRLRCASGVSAYPRHEPSSAARGPRCIKLALRVHARLRPPYSATISTPSWPFRPRLSDPLLRPSHLPTPLLYSYPAVYPLPLRHPISLCPTSSTPFHFATPPPTSLCSARWPSSAPTAAARTSQHSVLWLTVVMCFAMSTARGHTASGWRRPSPLRRRLRRPQRRLRHGMRRLRPRRVGSQLTPKRTGGG